MKPPRCPSSPLIELCAGGIEDVILAADCPLDFGSIVREGFSGYGTADHAQLLELMSIASKFTTERAVCRFKPP